MAESANAISPEDFAERIKALGFDRASGTYGRDTLAAMIRVRDAELQREARLAGCVPERAR